MQEGVLPEWLDLRRVGASGARLEGTVAVSGLRRLCARLESGEGEASAEVAVAFDQARQAVVSGRVRATVVMRCERCLGAVEVPLAGEFALAVVESEPAADRLPAEEEPVLAERGRLAVHALLEDELLLALPIVARHEDTACDGGRRLFGPDGEVPEAEREHPFAALAALKRDAEE